MLNRLIKHLFSRLIIPYNPQGLRAGETNKKIKSFLQNHLYISNISEFGNAFTSLLDTMDQPEFPDYIKKVCDPQLAESFLIGLQQIQKKELQMEKTIDQNISEHVLCSRAHYLLFLNQDISLYEQQQYYKDDDTNSSTVVFPDIGTKFGINMLLDLYIRTHLSWRIEGQEYNPDSYHLVRFLVYQEEEPIGLFNFFWALITKNSKKRFLGRNPEWRIVDIDNYMKNKYPEGL